MTQGAPAADAPLDDGQGPPWLLRRLATNGFSVLVFGESRLAEELARAVAANPPAAVDGKTIAIQVLGLPAEGTAARRYDARPGTVYLLRPDQHISARWRSANGDDLRHAIDRALARAGAH